jgi:hypothetical protein
MGERAVVKAVNALTTDSSDSSKAANEVTTCSSGISAPYRELLEVYRHGFAGSHESVKRFVRRLSATAIDARCFIETAPYEQVDHGKGPTLRDLLTGTYRATRLFVLTLRYGCKRVRLLTFKSSSGISCQLRETAFSTAGRRSESYGP